MKVEMYAEREVCRSVRCTLVRDVSHLLFLGKTFWSYTCDHQHDGYASFNFLNLVTRRLHDPNCNLPSEFDNGCEL